MILVVGATATEMASFRRRLLGQGIESLVAGIGPVETALNLGRRLTEDGRNVETVLNIGVAGAYPAGRVGLLDLCLARREVMADVGICFDDGIRSIYEPEPVPKTVFSPEMELLNAAGQILTAGNLPWREADFATVCCASGTEARGALLASGYQVDIENMEGAAVARVCEEFRIPWLELRCVSNLVEDRDPKRWRLTEACDRLGRAAYTLVSGLTLPARQ